MASPTFALTDILIRGRKTNSQVIVSGVPSRRDKKHKGRLIAGYYLHSASIILGAWNSVLLRDVVCFHSHAMYDSHMLLKHQPSVRGPPLRTVAADFPWTSPWTAPTEAPLRTTPKFNKKIKK